jgi:hypothetical protein
MWKLLLRFVAGCPDDRPPALEFGELKLFQLRRRRRGRFKSDRQDFGVYVREAYDRDDLILQPFDEFSRRARRGVEAKSSGHDDVDAAFPERWDIRQDCGP